MLTLPIRSFSLFWKIASEVSLKLLYKFQCQKQWTFTFWRVRSALVNLEMFIAGTAR